jgi:hypothetical protein
LLSIIALSSSEPLIVALFPRVNTRREKPVTDCAVNTQNLTDSQHQTLRERQRCLFWLSLQIIVLATRAIWKWRARWSAVVVHTTTKRSGQCNRKIVALFY